MLRKHSISLILLALILPNLWAQDDSSQQPSAKEQLLLTIVRDADRATRLEFLSKMESGTVGVDGDAVKALAYLAGDGTINRTTGGQNNYNNADIRTRAIGLLEKAGGDEAKAAIVYTMDHESEPFVLCAAFSAVGNLGLGDDKLPLRALNSAMRRNIALNSNDSVAYAYIDAVGKLVTSSNPDDETASTVLLLYQSGSYSSKTRKMASDLLDTFLQ